jgi:DNA-binding transcriptional LysR family regulator
MNLRFLRTFVGIAEAGSIRRANPRLNVSQPAASRQILALEAELGVRLFDRIGRRYRLTSEGEDLLRQSRQLLMEADLLTARARSLTGGHTGILRVAATPMVIETTLSPFLPQHRLRHPGVEVHVVEDGGVRLLTRLEHDDVHLAFVVPDNRFRSRLLYPVYNLAVVSKKHRFSRNRTLEDANLADEPLLLLHRGFGSREWLETACGVARIRPRVLVESMTPHALIALAAAGHGIAVVPSSAAIPSSVRALPLVRQGVVIGTWLTIAWSPRRVLAAYAEQFVDELVAACSRAYPGREFARRIPPVPRPKASDSGR